MWRVTIKGLLAHKLRLVLTGLAIVLGVTFIAGTFVLTDTLHNTFDSLFGNIYQNVNFQVRGVAQFGSGGTATRNPVPESVLGTIRAVPGVEAAAGSVEGYAQFINHDGKAISSGGAPTLGVAFDPNQQISALRIVQGRQPTAPNEVVMDLGTAQKYGFKVGQSVRILLQGPTRTFTITGIARFGTANNLAGATLAAFDTPTAQALLGSVGKFDSIDVVAQPGADKATVQRDIAAVLPHGVEVVTGQTVINEATNAISQGLGFFNTALLVFGFIALFVGGFTILNTFSITVGQRTRELALLRIVGASRRQVFRSVLGEAFIVGLVASLIGLGLGVLAALGLEKLLSAFGFSLPSGSLVFEARTVIVCLIVGVGVTMVSAISPARRAVRIAPVAAVSEQQVEQDIPMRRRFTRGGIITVIGVALLAYGLSKPAIQLVGLGAVLIFVGVAMLAPAVARPMASVIGRPLARLLGTSGRLGRENSMRSPKRTAQTASALMVGLALVSAIAVFGASLSRSATISVDNAVSADIIVSSTSKTGNGEFGNTVGIVASGVPGVTATSTVYADQFEFRALPGGPARRRDQEPDADGDPEHDVGDLEGACRRPAAHRHQHGEQRPRLGGRRRAGALRADGPHHDAHRGHLPAQRPGREVPRGRRVLLAALPEPAADGGAAQDGRQPRGAAGGRARAGVVPQRASAVAGPVRGVPDGPGEPAAGPGLRAARTCRDHRPHRDREHAHAVGLRAHARDRSAARRRHEAAPDPCHDPLRVGDPRRLRGGHRHHCRDGARHRPCVGAALAGHYQHRGAALGAGDLRDPGCPARPAGGELAGAAGRPAGRAGGHRRRLISAAIAFGVCAVVAAVGWPKTAEYLWIVVIFPLVVLRLLTVHRDSGAPDSPVHRRSYRFLRFLQI